MKGKLVKAADSWQCSLALVCAIMALGGCSKEEVKSFGASIQNSAQDFANDARSYAGAAVQKVEEVIPASGSASLRLDSPIDIDTASVQVIEVGGGRGNVVQITTYDVTKGPNSYPCLLVHGHTDVSAAQMLNGKSIDCDLYVQKSSGDPVKMTPPGKAVLVRFGPFDEKTNTLKASIGSTPLVASDNSIDTLNGGNVIAKVEGT